MKTVINLRKCMIGILMLSVTGGEMVQARRYTTYRKPVYTTGRYRVTVINHMSSPVRRDVQAGFKLLMQKYKETVYWYIRRLVVSHEDAQDVAQETFLRIFRSFSQFKGSCSFKAWIYRIATEEIAKVTCTKVLWHLQSIPDSKTNPTGLHTRKTSYEPSG